MDPQQAIEQPRFAPWNFPNSFWPHTYVPGRLDVEGRIPESTVQELSRRGHDVKVLNDWSVLMPPSNTETRGALSAIVVDQESGVLKGAADPRLDTYAIGK